MRVAYTCRAYPDPEQQVMLARTFGCIRVVWNRTLAARHARQAARYTRSAFRWQDGQLWLAKMHAPLRLVWSWPQVDPALLEPTGVTGNRRLAKAISDCGWGTFRGLLAYKAQRAGRRMVVIDRWHPSSKTCSSCGHLLATLSLGTRTWVCPTCGARHDRDHNAAKYILAAGRAVTACGADISHPGSSGVQAALKQEPQRVTAGIPVLQGGE